MTDRSPWWPWFVGAAVGVVLGAVNLVVGLEVGIGTSVAVTAVTLVAGVRVVLRARRWQLADGVIVQSVASAAGYSTGNALAAAGAALVLCTGRAPSAPVLVAWVLSSAWAGVALGSALRRSLVVDGQLRFPSGLAAGKMLSTLWAPGGAAWPSTRALLLTAALAAGLVVARDAGGLLPASLLLPGSAWLLGVELSPLALGTGALVGWRAALSLLLGLLALVGLGHARAAPETVVGFESVAPDALWAGLGLMVGGGLAPLARGFTGLRWRGAAPGRQYVRVLAPLACLALVGVLLLEVDPLAVLLATALVVPVAAISARVTGETDITPAGPLGNLTQVLVATRPVGLAGSAWSAGVTATAAATAADTLTDLATGHHLGVEPERQVRAQLWGTVVGAVAMAPLFALLATPDALANDFAAPAARVLAGVARATTSPAGLGAWPLRALALFGAAGLALGLLEAKLARREPPPFFPSPVAAGLAFLLPPSMTLAIAAGALVAVLARRHAERALVVATGALAGEGLAAVALAVARALTR